MHDLTGAVRAAAASHPAAGNLLRSVRSAFFTARFEGRTAGIRTDEKTVVLCSFEGKSYADSPKALFEYMVRCGEFRDFTFVWAFAGDAEILKKRRRQLAKAVMAAQKGGPPAGPDAARLPRIAVVEYGSASYERALSRAKYWILNFKVKDHIRPRSSQVFVQCWHGTPFKKLGYDITHYDHPENTAEGLSKHYGTEAKKFTYFLSPSPYASEKFRSAWRLDAIGKGDVILEEGYPRNDILANAAPEDASRMRERILRRAAGTAAGGSAPDAFDAGHKKIILYAPTYRQNQFAGGTYTASAPLDFRKLRDAIGGACLILLRAHYMTFNAFDLRGLEDFVLDVSDVDDINDLYLISDLLITDYSSVMFDFSVLRRPMIFFMYDLEYYRDVSNGFYFNPEGILPGPIVRTQEELTAAIRTAVTEGGATAEGRASSAEYAQSYAHFCEVFCPKEDGHASERVVRRIFDAP